MSEDEVQAECSAALADVGIAPDRVRFFRLAALGTGHVGAAWWRPYSDIEDDDPSFPDGTQRAEANLPENRARHRIAVPAAPTDAPVFAALVRHELEHARQFDARLGIFDLHDFIERDVLPEIAGGLNGCGGGLINTIPTEIDCNAASSVYVSGRFSAAEIQAIRDSDRKYLACSLLPPPPPQTLPARMIAFAFVHRAAVERHAARVGFPVASMLRAVHPQAPDLWSRLEQGL